MASPTYNVNYGAAGANAMMGFAALAGASNQERARLEDRSEAREANLIQFLGQQEAAKRAQQESRNMQMQTLSLEQSRIAQQGQDNAFRRLSLALDSQLKIANSLREDRESAMRLSMEQTKFELETKKNTLILKELEDQSAFLDRQSEYKAARAEWQATGDHKAYHDKLRDTLGKRGGGKLGDVIGPELGMLKQIRLDVPDMDLVGESLTIGKLEDVVSRMNFENDISANEHQALGFLAGEAGVLSTDSPEEAKTKFLGHILQKQKEAGSPYKAIAAKFSNPKAAAQVATLQREGLLTNIIKDKDTLAEYDKRMIAIARMEQKLDEATDGMWRFDTVDPNNVLARDQIRGLRKQAVVEASGTRSPTAVDALSGGVAFADIADDLEDKLLRAGRTLERGSVGEIIREGYKTVKKSAVKTVLTPLGGAVAVDAVRMLRTDELDIARERAEEAEMNMKMLRTDESVGRFLAAVEAYKVELSVRAPEKDQFYIKNGLKPMSVLPATLIPRVNASAVSAIAGSGEEAGLTQQLVEAQKVYGGGTASGIYSILGRGTSSQGTAQRSAAPQASTAPWGQPSSDN